MAKAKSFRLRPRKKLRPRGLNTALGGMANYHNGNRLKHNELSQDAKEMELAAKKYIGHKLIPNVIV